MKRLLILIIPLIVFGLLNQSQSGCSSREMTTAKMAFSKKDYDKAFESVNKELQKNPDNEEALDLAINLSFIKRDFIGASSYLKRLESVAKTDEFKKKIPLYEQQIWTNAYNQAIGYFNKYIQLKNNEYADSSIKYFDIGSEIRPRKVEFYSNLASLYENTGDTAKAIEYFTKYIEELKEETKFARQNNIYLKQPYGEVLSKFGSPEKTQSDSMQTGDITRADLFQINSDEVITYARKEQNKDWELVGWRLNLPASWSMAEKIRNMFYMNMASYSALTDYAYRAGQIDRALELIRIILIYEPYNDRANSFMVQLYKETGKLADAIARLEEVIKKNPENKLYWAQMGDLVTSQQKYDEAIVSYQTALDLDSDYDIVLRNLGSTYKNKASIVQGKQIDRLEADPNFQPDPEEYFPFLRKSAEYFEKSLRTPKFKNDFQVLSELANIYMVLSNGDKLNITLTKLEDLENMISDEYKEQYYLTLLKIYGDRKNKTKIDEVTKKLDALR